MKNLRDFIDKQLSLWPMAKDNFTLLSKAEFKTLEINDFVVSLQNNPARTISSAAKLDLKSIQNRKCFLCGSNRPDNQISLDFEGGENRKYDILINPYPIFKDHLVIASKEHIDQCILKKYIDILTLSATYQDFTFFYNGPKSGASAPDHHHFQACPRETMPLEKEVDKCLSDSCLDLIYSLNNDSKIFHYKKFTRGIFVLDSSSLEDIQELFDTLLEALPIKEDMQEPMLNLITWVTNGRYRSIVIARESHRSHHFYSDGDDHLMMSPGCADMGAMFVVPAREDFEKINKKLLEEMLFEVSIKKEDEQKTVYNLEKKLLEQEHRSKQRTLAVGILKAEKICFEIIKKGLKEEVSYKDGKILYKGELHNELIFSQEPCDIDFAEPSFILYDVVIGIDFHWERKVNQKFAGTLKFIVEDKQIRAVNVIGVEDYLLSVISSEMKSSATLEYLKAHSVISRSWVISQIINKHTVVEPVQAVVEPVSSTVVEPVETNCLHGGRACRDQINREYIKWFDREDHSLFDICADDHCQRYQGIGMAVGENVKTAIKQTWGQILSSDGEVCDTRFSKCCGGTMETFSTCWEDKDYAYLQAVPDTKNYEKAGRVFCDTTDKEILSQVLNDYDLETYDFYRWEVKYTKEELSNLVKRHSPQDLGIITELIPIERGGSGRLKRLKLIGTKGELVIGKELIIRRFLSDSHLKSSDFDVHYYNTKNEEVNKGEDFEYFVLKGRGWGHGVGFCQIGAAVMAYEGYDYKQILQHYYPTSTLIDKL